MGSIIMHIAVSKIVAEKHNFSYKFIAGSIMPDIYAKCGIDRNITHYTNNSNSYLPNYEKYIELHRDTLKNEMTLGYLAHLIEDYVWFTMFIDKYIKVLSYETFEVQYLFDNTIHTNKDFFNEIYKDYDYIDDYLIKLYGISIDEIKINISKYFENFGSREKLNEYLCKHKYDKNRDNVFITKQDIEDFIEKASNEVEKTIRLFL